MSVSIQHKRGLKANLPASGAAGEFFYTTDTQELFIGTGASLVSLQVNWANLLGIPTGLGTIPTNAQVGTSYTIVTGDSGKLLTLSNAAAVAVTLPQAGSAGFLAGFYVRVSNKGVGQATITPTTSTINGASSLLIPQNGSVLIVSDGTNYQVFGIVPTPSATTLGGVKSFTAPLHQFLTQVGTDGSISSAQPSFTDLTGSLSAAQLPATIDCGTF